MVVQLRSYLKICLFLMIMLAGNVSAEEIFKGIENSYGLKDPDSYTVTDYEDNGWEKKYKGMKQKGCCCWRTIADYGEANVKYIVGDHLAKAIDNTQITINSLTSSTKFYDKLIHNLKRLLQLKSNWKDDRNGTILLQYANNFNADKINDSLAQSITKDIGETDYAVMQYVLMKTMGKR